MSRFDEKIAKEALVAVHPLISNAMTVGLAKRSHLHVIIGTSQGKILAAESYGIESEWEYPYKEVAESKFNITIRTGKPTRVVQQLTPELTGEEGDTFYWGSWIDGGIVVACSGVEAYWDEAFSKCLVAVIRAMVTAKQEKEMSNGGDFR